MAQAGGGYRRWTRRRRVSPALAPVARLLANGLYGIARCRPESYDSRVNRPAGLKVLFLLVATAAGLACNKSEPTEQPTAHASSPEGQAAAAPADAEVIEDPEASEEQPEISPDSLLGQHGFDWRKGEAARCHELDDAWLTENQPEACSRREPGESFGVDIGPWVSCQSESGEWFVFPTAEICIDMLETMRAHAP
jgi:hypothetical protein